MYRQALDKLKEWKKSSTRIPLIIRGARQVGKTWLMEEFAKTSYRKDAYINFEGNDRMKRFFESDLEIPRIIKGLSLEAECNIEPENTLIIFDEVQEVPRALTSLKYFQENAPQYHIIAAGSLLGVALHPETSFPVGKVSFLDLFPLSFTEFMQAMEMQKYLDLLLNKDWDLISGFKDRYMELLKQYFFIGGMPEAVAAFIQRQDYKEVREIQLRVIAAYEQDFSKHAPNETVPRIRMLWNSIPSQLARENRKFVYGLIRKGARARDYELAMMWLADCGLIHKVNRITKPGLPLRSYEDTKAFKLYMLDTGLLSALSGLDAKTLLNEDKILTEFKGALTEQYVLQQFKCEKLHSVFYWSAEAGTSEIDFIIQIDNRIIPVEVKASENLRAKSLKIYREKYLPEISIRLSMSDYRKEGWLINLPLYALPVLPEILSKKNLL
ncbi:MAG: ATP-binding protein [Actinobacteria bacterium]|nr:ATP-binding protein [Actinomycetota bacterium]